MGNTKLTSSSFVRVGWLALILFNFIVVDFGVCASERAAVGFASLPAEIEGATTYIYKSTPKAALPIYVYHPALVAEPAENKAAVVFFHGSGWISGSVRQFEPYARALASHGIVAALVEYRVSMDYGASPFEGLEDVGDAISWLRDNAHRLNIDPHKIVASGASSGAHLALTVAVLAEDAKPQVESTLTSSVPDALVLFAPIVDVSEAGYKDSAGLALFEGREVELSPIEQLHKSLPPTLIIQGTADKWVPYESVVKFSNLAKGQGLSLRLVPFIGGDHHFYNHKDYLLSRPNLASRAGQSEFNFTLYLLEAFLYEQKMIRELPPVLPSAAVK